MTKCPQCGTAVEAAQRFCSGCGTRLHGEAPAGDRNAVMHRPGGGRPDPFEVGGSDDANGDDFFSQFTPKSSLPADRPLPSRRSRRRFNPSLYPTGEVPSQMPDAGQRPSPAGEPPRPPAEPPRPAGEFWAAPAADDGAAHDDGPPTAAMSHDEIQEALADRQAPVPAEPPAEPFAFQPPAPPFPAAEAPIDPFAPPAAAGPGFGPGAGADARGEQDASGAFVPPPAEAGPVGLGYEPPAPAPVLDQGEAEAEDVTMPDWFAELVDDGEPEPEPEAPTAAAPMPPTGAHPGAPTHGDRVEHDDWSAERSADAERAAAFWGAQGGPPAAAVPPQGSAFQAPPPPVQAPRGDGEASFTQLIRGIDDDPADRPIESPGFDPTGIVPLPPREQLEDDAELRAAQERAAAFWGVSKTPEPAEPAEPAAPFAAPGGPVPGAGAPAGHGGFAPPADEHAGAQVDPFAAPAAHEHVGSAAGGDEGADARDRFALPHDDAAAGGFGPADDAADEGGDRFALPADSWFAEGPGAQGDAGADGAEPRAPFAGPAYGDAPAAAPEHASGGPASDRAESDHDDELFAGGWFTETAEHGPVDDGRGAHAAGP
ncbi:MAG: zinc ribbon domain-containing protein, partial [Microbacteriaceae bacterium]|nr:zinc ribbon domain-containing protein [Microbacteriaceae bacterium]